MSRKGSSSGTKKTTDSEQMFSEPKPIPESDKINFSSEYASASSYSEYSFSPEYISSDESSGEPPIEIFPFIPPPEDKVEPIPLYRWTKPSQKPERFNFTAPVECLTPFELNVGDIHLRWVDGYWFNLGTDYEAATTKLTKKTKIDILKENDLLRTQVEVLLDLNTELEIKKAKLRAKLEKLENEIRKYPGVQSKNYDSDISL